jgi:flagellar biosynthesis/type III secretory pathway protein FliH
MPSSDAAGAFVPLVAAPAAAPFRPLATPAADAAGAEGAPADPRDVAYAAGEAAARAAAAIEQAALAQDVARALEAIGAWRDELRARYVPLLLQVALDTARAIVGEELAAEPDRWRTIIAGAVRDLVDRERVVVRVGPRLAAVLRSLPGPLAPGLADGVRLVDDPALGPEGCVVESERGCVDCGVERQLAVAADALGLGGA